MRRNSVHYYGSDEMQRHVYVEERGDTYVVCRRIFHRKWSEPVVLFTSKNPLHLEYQENDVLPRIIERTPSEQDTWIVALERVAKGAKYSSGNDVPIKFNYTMLGRLIKSSGKEAKYPKILRIAGSSYSANPAIKVVGTLRDMAITISNNIDAAEIKAGELLQRIEAKEALKKREFLTALGAEEENDLLLLWEEE